jgi:hypothetical protein
VDQLIKKNQKTEGKKKVKKEGEQPAATPTEEGNLFREVAKLLERLVPLTIMYSGVYRQTIFSQQKLDSFHTIVEHAARLEPKKFKLAPPKFMQQLKQKNDEKEMGKNRKQKREDNKSRRPEVGNDQRVR